MPIDWDELDDPDLAPDGFDIHNALRRLEKRGDLFLPVLQSRQELPHLS